MSQSRRRFLQGMSTVCATAAVSTHLPLLAASQPARVTGADWQIPDDGWTLWVDKKAQWEQDELYLPDTFDLKQLAVHPPTGGWQALYQQPVGPDCMAVTLPATVEEYRWGAYGERPYTPEEYRYAANDVVPQNGAYRGVSWFYREVTLPASVNGKRLLLKIRGARLRAEVYWNEQLVGYSIMEELPIECDVTEAMQPGGLNRLAIRITNPGGRYDWVDGLSMPWGKVALYRSHGFGGLDRELTLRAVPNAGHMTDLWVLNTPQATTVTALAKCSHPSAGNVLFEVLQQDGKVVASRMGQRVLKPRPDGADTMATLTVAGASLWDLHAPSLYQLRATQTLPGGEKDVRTLSFGFRWFSPEGLGKDALFRLNGRRIKVYTSISWGFWGFNGLFPTPQLAEREVMQAKRLGLNCLNFHRNVGKQEVMRAHDRMGLLRYMEPGGGKLAIGKLPEGVAANSAGIVMENPKTMADQFSQRYMLEKCRAMVRTFRSHPSLIQYTLQNELGADLKNPSTWVALEAMHAEDPSRCVVLNDGFSPPPRNAAQAWFAPYQDTMYRSDQEPFAYWWNNHQGAGDQWYDMFYKNAKSFTYLQPMREALVEFGEMEGCAVADHHSLMVQQIRESTLGGHGSSYDLADHESIAKAYDTFFDRWGFRSAFPSSEHFYLSLGNKCYESWQQYMENIRICDEVDFAAISGWESTAIENHSGIVDNLRNFKGDPDLIASSLWPIRPVVKQHAFAYATDEVAVFDLFLLNDSGAMPQGKLSLVMEDPQGKRTMLGSWAMPSLIADCFSYTIVTELRTPRLTMAGTYVFRFSVDTLPKTACVREILVVAAKPALHKPLKVAVHRLLANVARQLSVLEGIEVAEFSSGIACDVIVASGVMPGSKLDRPIGEETGLEEPPAKGAPIVPQTPGQLSEEILQAVQQGTPLLVMTPEDDLADGVAKQLASLGAFHYSGQVGDTRAPWMGNWLFVRQHATFANLPADKVLGVHEQAWGKACNGLMIDRVEGKPDLEVVMGYSRDHDRNIGAASFICHVGNTPVLFHRAPSLSHPLQQQWLANALNVLTEG